MSADPFFYTKARDICANALSCKAQLEVLAALIRDLEAGQA